MFSLLKHYQPESRAEKKERLAAEKEAGASSGKGPKTFQYGLNNVVSLVEKKKAKLLVIAHDAEPAELTLFLPTLCRKMGVPFCIVTGKADLGKLTYKKTATAIAITDVSKEHASQLAKIIEAVNPLYLNLDAREVNSWGGLKLGTKSAAAAFKIEQRRKREESQKRRD